MRAVGSTFIAAGLASLVVAAPAFAAPVVRGSVEQVQVTGAPDGARVVLLHKGKRVANIDARLFQHDRLVASANGNFAIFAAPHAL
jgi:hypothetical protein